MSDLRGLSTATSEEGSRPKYERLHRIAMPNLHLRGGRQNHSGHFEANHSAGVVQHAPTERGGPGSGGHDCQNHEGGGGRLSEMKSRAGWSPHREGRHQAKTLLNITAVGTLLPPRWRQYT